MIAWLKKYSVFLAWGGYVGLAVAAFFAPWGLRALIFASGLAVAVARQVNGKP
ncbi:MAG: hypothetical protein ACREBG_20620 [Pyrinomonadaceae bacterium]